MYICNCNGITEREIEGAIELGCETLADLGRELGVGTCCGKCVPDARKLLARHEVEKVLEVPRCEAMPRSSSSSMGSSPAS